MQTKTWLLATSILAAFGAVESAQAQNQQRNQQVSNQRLIQEQAQGSGAVVFVSTAGVRQIEQALNQQGYSAGNIDGIWDQSTSQAARNFQQAQGLEPTGTLTIPLVYALGLEQQIISGQIGDGQQASQTGQGQGQAGQQASNQRLAQEQAQGRGEPLHVSPAGVRQIQQALNQQGYSVGQVDGQWGQATSQAARNFQQAQGLEPNGKLDISLIAALGLNEQIFSGGGGQQTSQAGQGQGQAGQQASNQRLAQEQAQGPGEPLWMSPPVVRQIQQALNQRGYSSGNIDGSWGQDTMRAAGNFQQAQGLEPTGTLTTNLLAALGMDNWTSGQFLSGMSTAGQGNQPATTGATGTTGTTGGRNPPPPAGSTGQGGNQTAPQQ